jgi:hypothetical protein
LERALPFFAAVFAPEIEVTPTGADLVPELRAVGEVFAVEELVFEQAVDGLDIALPGVALGRDGRVTGSQRPHGGGQAAFFFVFQKLAAVVGLPSDAPRIDAVMGQVGGRGFRPGARA